MLNVESLTSQHIGLPLHSCGAELPWPVWSHPKASPDRKGCLSDALAQGARG
jgi:hypothetical protein